MKAMWRMHYYDLIYSLFNPPEGISTLNTSRHSYFQVHIEHWYKLVIEKGYETGGYSINQPNLIFFWLL